MVTFFAQESHLLAQEYINAYFLRCARTRGGGGTRVLFGWVCAARDSKLAPRSKKKSPNIDTPF